jgi:GAF domain-containing protein
LQQEQTVELKSLASERNGNESGLEEPHNALATPLKLRDQVIGVLGIHSNDLQRQWTTDEIALIEAVSEQMSLAIENARLFDETGRRAGRERMIADVTQQVWASGELERVMQTVVEQLGLKLDASKVVIRLGTEEELLSGSPSDHKFEKQATRL